MSLMEQECSGFGSVLVLPAVEEEHSVHDTPIGSCYRLDVIVFPARVFRPVGCQVPLLFPRVALVAGYPLLNGSAAVSVHVAARVEVPGTDDQIGVQCAAIVPGQMAAIPLMVGAGYRRLPPFAAGASDVIVPVLGERFF